MAFLRQCLEELRRPDRGTGALGQCERRSEPMPVWRSDPAPRSAPLIPTVRRKDK